MDVVVDGSYPLEAADVDCMLLQCTCIVSIGCRYAGALCFSDLMFYVQLIGEGLALWLGNFYGVRANSHAG